MGSRSEEKKRAGIGGLGDGRREERRVKRVEDRNSWELALAGPRAGTRWNFRVREGAWGNRRGCDWEATGEGGSQAYNVDRRFL